MRHASYICPMRDCCGDDFGPVWLPQRSEQLGVRLELGIRKQKPRRFELDGQQFIHPAATTLGWRHAFWQRFERGIHNSAVLWVGLS